MSSPVNIPEAVSLALHALTKLTTSQDESVKLNDLLIKPGSADHLSKVMQKLVAAGMVNSKRGRNGGFSLAVAPEDLRLMDVWLAIEGTFQSGSCPYLNRGCGLSRCIFASIFKEASEVIREYFTETTLADLGRIPER
jgi:Rrf2 family nitric oxide-sensitive transcriptional repressor